MTTSATGEDTSWVARFHADLMREVRHRSRAETRGALPHDSAGALAAAATQPAMVALLSDRYFGDIACGRQWAIMAARIALAEARTGRPPDVPCIVPVLWRPLQGRVPDAARLAVPGWSDALGHTVAGGGGSTPVHEQMRLHRNVQGASYFATLHDVARGVIEANDVRLPPWPEENIVHVAAAFGYRPPATTEPLAASPSSRH